MDDQPVFCGGNLQGVAEKLDYLSDLGINTLWLSPFHKTAAYHGYHITDFFAVEKRFGGKPGLQTLVAAARKRRIRLVMDFVPNHVHMSHPWFEQARTRRRSPYRDWFYWLPNGDYLKFLDVRELPKLNLDHPGARCVMIEAAKYWLDCGIDGFRLDHALGPSLSFWSEFRRELKQHRADVALFAEVWFSGIRRPLLNTLSLPDKQLYYAAQKKLGFDVCSAVMREYAGFFDGLLDFRFQTLLKTHIATAVRRVSDAEIQKQLDEHYASFPGGCSLLSFLDNHDMNRFLFEAGGDRSRLERAWEIQFAQRQPPIIYYGTEIGMNQAGPVRGPYGDLHVRRMMAWDKPDHELLGACKRLVAGWKKAGR